MILRFFISFVMLLNSAMAMECSAVIQNEDGQYLARLLKDGDQFWGNYICKNCDNVNTMRPNKENRTVCIGCGTPHTNETYFEPAQIWHDGRSYLLEPGAFIGPGDKTKAEANSGRKWTCPFCTSSNFTTQNSCPGCGAYVKNGWPKQLRDYAPKAEQTQFLQQGSASSSKEDYSKVLPQSVVASDTKALRKKYGIIGSAILGVIVSGTVYYFKETHVTPGTISSVQGTHVSVDYQKDNKIDTMSFELPSNRTQPRLGEEVSVHWNRSHGAFAVERANGDYGSNQK